MKGEKTKFGPGLIPKLCAFGLALLNLIYIWSHHVSQELPSGTFNENIEWYEAYSLTNEPPILFLASILLLLNRRWSILFASVLSGFVLTNGLFYLTRAVYYFGFFSLMEGMRRYEVNILLMREMQTVWAGFIFCLAAFYLLVDWRKR